MRFANPIRLLLSTALVLSVAATAHAQNYKQQRRQANSYGRRSAPAAQRQQPQMRQSFNPQNGGGRPQYVPQQQQHAPQQPSNQNRAQFQPQPQQQRQFQPQQPAMGNQSHGGTPLAPIERRDAAGTPNSAGANSAHGEHLAEWMNNHHNLSPTQQQQALENEPGFHDLPQATQQRMHDRLAQLNAMPPQQQNRIIQRNEWMEHLSPDQRTQVRNATQNWATLPADQRAAVGRSFRALRALPPDQRGAALNSGRYSYGFNDQQRSALNGLMRAEPIMPPE